MAVVNSYDVHTAFRGKSNRQIYGEACEYLKIKKNSSLLNAFDDRKDNLYLKELRITENYIGNRGTQALLPVVQANKVLRTIALPGQSLTDETVEKLLSVIREHPRVTELDIGANREVTTRTGHTMIKLVTDNKMLCKVNCRGTSIGENIIKKIEQLANSNSNHETNFFQSDYFRFRKVFQQLDANNRGAVSTNDIVMNIDIPQVADHLMEKFASLQTGVLSSTDEVKLNVNQFLYFTYPDFISHYEIVEQASKEDKAEDVIVANWEQCQWALTYLHLLCKDYKAICIGDKVLPEQDWKKACDIGFKWQSTSGPDGYDVQVDPHTSRHLVSPVAIKQGLKSVYTFPRNTRQGGQIQNWKMSPNLLRKVIVRWKKEGDADDDGDYQVDLTIGVDELLSVTYETNLARLNVAQLLPKFEEHGLSNYLKISLEEWVNIVEEYYDTIVVPLAGPAILSNKELEQFNRPPTPKTPRTPKSNPPRAGGFRRHIK